MARSGFVVSLLSQVYNGRNLNSLLFLLRARMFLLPCVLLTATLALAQYDVGGNGVQPTEATNGEVSLDTLNIHLDIPVVSKSGVGLPFSFGLHFNNNIWLLSSGAWSYNTHSNFWVGDGWYPTNTYGIEGFFVSGPLITCNGIQWSNYAGYQDSSGNIHSFSPVIIASQNGQYGCPTFTTYSTLISDGSGITVNLSYAGPNTITFKDGTVITVSDGSTSIVDVNKNKISVGPINQGGAITDTLGVTELTENGADCYSGGVGGSSSFSYPTSTGTATVTVNCTDEPIQTKFGCSGITEFSGTSTYLPANIVLPDGSSYQFTYESQVAGTVTGRLASVTYPSGETVSYTYPGSNNGINCSDGSTAGLTRTLSAGETYTYTRSGNWLTTTLVGPLPANNTNVYTFITGRGGTFLSQVVENQGASTVLRTKVYCYNGNLTNCVTATAPTLPLTETDVYTTLAAMTTATRTSTTFDSYGNVTKIALYDFGATTPTHQTVVGPYGYTWNGSTTSPTCTTPVGSGVYNKPCQVQLQNGSGSMLRNSYFQYGTATNPGSLLSSAVLTSGSTYLTSSATYNPNGTVAASFDANGNKTSATYNACNSGMLTQLTLPNTLNKQVGWDSGCNGAVPVKVTGLDGNYITSAYNDPFWRITSLTDQTQVNQTTTSYGYNPPTVESILNFGTSTVDKFKQVNVNALTVYSQQRESPSSSNWDTVQSGYVWGSTGKTTSKSMPCATTKSSGCTNGVTTITHDALNRPMIATDGGLGTLTYTYTGSSSCTSSLPGCYITTTVLGPAPTGEVVKEVAQEYNGLGQLLASCIISSATGSTACGFGGYTGFHTTYVYNTDGTLASVSKSSSTNTQTRSFTYDALGRTLTAAYPESGTKQFFFDSAPSTPGVACSTLSLPTNLSPLGNLLKTYDANGTTTCYSYDSLNRTIGVAYSGANFEGANKYFVYDSATVNGVVMSNTGGRLAEAYTSATFGGTKITDTGFSYTVRGEKSDVYEMTPKSGEYYHTNATYFANGLLSTLSDVVGDVTWAYTPDGKGRPYSAIQNPSTNLVSSTTYNAANEPCVVTLGLGDTDTYVYDGVSCTGLLTTGRMTSYTFSVGATPKTDAGSLTWNANGTLRSLGITDGFNTGGTQTCNYGTSSTPGYDEQGRLVSAVCANSGGTNVWGQQFSYDAFQNLTKTVPNGDTGVTWSPGYYQTNNQAIGFSYDANGNLLSDGTNSYTWNQDNHPVSVNTSPATYDAFGNMVENKTDSTALLEELQSPVGNIGIMKKTTVTEYRIPLPGGDTYSVASSNLIWHRDWLGSVRLTSNISNRNYVADMAFAPYGEIYLGFGSTANLNFTGDNQDLITGDFDTPNRELLPTEGRWLSPDPAHASWNVYSYSTNPLGATDPSGLDDNGIRVPLNLACGIGTCDGGLGGGGASQSNLAGLLDPGAAFINGAFQQFQTLVGANPVTESFMNYLAQVDDGANGTHYTDAPGFFTSTHYTLMVPTVDFYEPVTYAGGLIDYFTGSWSDPAEPIPNVANTSSEYWQAYNAGVAYIRDPRSYMNSDEKYIFNLSNQINFNSYNLFGTTLTESACIGASLALTEAGFTVEGKGIDILSKYAGAMGLAGCGI